jgi:DNA repair exonuclease SbcCD ATPase subunit
MDDLEKRKKELRIRIEALKNRISNEIFQNLLKALDCVITLDDCDELERIIQEIESRLTDLVNFFKEINDFIKKNERKPQNVSSNKPPGGGGRS